MHNNLITEPEHAWFRADRERRAGKSLEQWEADSGGESAWTAAQPGLERLAKLLKEHKRDEGAFMLGSQVCYADLMATSLVEFYRRIDQSLFDRLTASVDGLKELYSACAPWFERNDH